ncbi:golgin subfamily A member 6-like protein 22 [Clupea harengus]|uniref:Golgin subfamily A member 6-like protein 22 n=1 Tax=Clupea harengus TaxID=7950 RepID=A0A8M1KPB8_CLUHA|nr:golgin subfamily A member 6-like protein 22 [Clupea harengus]
MMWKIEEETSQLWKSMGLSFEDTEDGSEEDWKESEEASVDLDLLFLKDNGTTKIDREKERRLEEENKSRQLKVETQREMKTVRLKEEESKRKAMMEQLKEDERRKRGMEAEMERKEQEERLREKERAKLREEERKKKEMQEKTRRELEQITQREREEKGKKAKVANKLIQARDSDDIDVESLSDEDMWKDKELPMDQKKRQTKDEKEHAWLQEKHNKEKEDENVTNSNSLWMHEAKSRKLSVSNAWMIEQYDNTETDHVKQGISEVYVDTWTQLKAKTDEEDAEREKQSQMEEKRMREVDNGGKKKERKQGEMVAQTANKPPKISRDLEIVQKIEEERKKEEMEKAAQKEQKEAERRKIEIEEERKVREREEMRKIVEVMNRRWEALPGDSDDRNGATDSDDLWMDEVEKRRQVEVINPQNKPQEEGERGHTLPGSAQVNVEQKKKGRSVLKWLKKRLSFGTTKVKQ